MLTEEEATRVVGATLVSADGEQVGEVRSVLTHAADNRAAWALTQVSDKLVPVPLDQARTEGDQLVVRYAADAIQAAPAHEDETLTADATERFYQHYGIDDSVLRDDSGFATEEGGREQGSSRDPRGNPGTETGHGHP